MSDSPTQNPLAVAATTETVRALNRVVADATQPMAQVLQRLAESLQPIFEVQNQMARQIERTLNRRDVRRLLNSLADVARRAPEFFEEFSNIVPANLHGLESIEKIASLALDEGLPLVWVPRHEIVQMLIQAPDSNTRQQILIDQHSAILDDCSAALNECRSILEDRDSDLSALCLEWTYQTEEAANTLIAGFHGSAQSHATNIIDSIFRRLVNWSTEKDKGEFQRNEIEGNINDPERTIHTLGYYLSLQPLPKAYARWFPDGGTPPPEHFDRHATAHAVGYPNIFKEHYALIAVMLATSLTRQLCHEATRNLPSVEAAA